MPNRPVILDAEGKSNFPKIEDLDTHTRVYLRARIRCSNVQVNFTYSCNLTLPIVQANLLVNVHHVFPFSKSSS